MHDLFLRAMNFLTLSCQPTLPNITSSINFARPRSLIIPGSSSTCKCCFRASGISFVVVQDTCAIAPAATSRDCHDNVQSAEPAIDGLCGSGDNLQFDTCGTYPNCCTLCKTRSTMFLSFFTKNVIEKATTLT